MPSWRGMHYPLPGAAMAVRIATAQDAAGIVALHRSTNAYGDWYRNPHLGLGPAPYEDLTPLERFLHGGFWMDLSLFRRHFHEFRKRGFPVLVAEEGGRVVGECEVWLDAEPEPFGRYAHVVHVASSPPEPEVEGGMLRAAAGRVGKMGYGALDLAPLHSGGGDAAEGLGFEPVWDTRTFECGSDEIPPPDEEVTGTYLAGDYAPVSSLLLLGHREPARWRFETAATLWPAAKVAGLGDAQKLVAMAIDSERSRSAVLARRREWLEPKVSEVDVWMDPAERDSPSSVRRAFSIAVEVSRRLRAERTRTFAPEDAVETLREMGFVGGDAPDRWLRWTF